jgi:hypothetical protein
MLLLLCIQYTLQGAEGKRFQEGIDINKGLLTLGNVISALGDEVRVLQLLELSLLYNSAVLESTTCMYAFCSCFDTQLITQPTIQLYAVQHAVVVGSAGVAHQTHLLRVLTIACVTLFTASFVLASSQSEARCMCLTETQS